MCLDGAKVIIISSAHAADVIITTYHATIAAIDDQTKIIDAAHAANEIMSNHCATVAAIVDRVGL